MSGNRLISFFIDYIVTDFNLLHVSGSVQVDTTDIGKSDHFLVWMELCRTVKTTGD